jgi:hypothetical protein
MSYQNLRVQDLKTELRKRKLSVSGSKPLLIERLETNDLEQLDSPPASPPASPPVSPRASRRVKKSNDPNKLPKGSREMVMKMFMALVCVGVVATTLSNNPVCRSMLCENLNIGCPSAPIDWSMIGLYYLTVVLVTAIHLGFGYLWHDRCFSELFTWIFFDSLRRKKPSGDEFMKIALRNNVIGYFIVNLVLGKIVMAAGHSSLMGSISTALVLFPLQLGLDLSHMFWEGHNNGAILFRSAYNLCAIVINAVAFHYLFHCMGIW